MGHFDINFLVFVSSNILMVGYIYNLEYNMAHGINVSIEAIVNASC